MIEKTIKFFRFLLTTTLFQTVLFFGVSLLFYDGILLNDETYLTKKVSEFPTEIESYFYVYFFSISFLVSNIFCYSFALFVSKERLGKIFILWFFSLVFIFLISYFGADFAFVFLFGLVVGLFTTNKNLIGLD